MFHFGLLIKFYFSLLTMILLTTLVIFVNFMEKRLVEATSQIEFVTKLFETFLLPLLLISLLFLLNFIVFYILIPHLSFLYLCF